MDDLDHLTTLTECGGAILPSQIDLAQMMVKRPRMGSKAPKIRVVVGKHYGRNANGSCKPIRAMLEGRVEVSNCDNMSPTENLTFIKDFGQSYWSIR